MVMMLILEGGGNESVCAVNSTFMHVWKFLFLFTIP